MANTSYFDDVVAEAAFEGRILTQEHLESLMQESEAIFSEAQRFADEANEDMLFWMNSEGYGRMELRELIADGEF